MSRWFAALFLCLLLAALLGCGNKGPLSLPGESDNQVEDNS